MPVDRTLRVIDVRGPADFEFVRILRSTSLGIGSRAGLAIDPCDDLRAAVDAASSALIDAGADELLATFVDDGEQIAVTVRSRRGEAGMHVDPRTILVLTALLDSFQVTADGAVILVLRLPPAR